jgi:Domain of unknown function (DUF3854)
MQPNSNNCSGFILEPRRFSSDISVNIDPDHVQEWLDSGVDPAIIALNVRTLTDTLVDPASHEVSYPIAERLNWKITRFGQNTRASVRGWWVSGVDPLADWQPMTWGRFKPDSATPVVDRTQGKAAKYLSPSLGKGSSRLVLLDVPGSIWQQVADRHNCPIDPAQMGGMSFWQWVWENNIPVVLTEGEKKAGCLLTQGYAAIALPGIFNGYRRDSRQLVAELAHFATTARVVHICFDYETKPHTVRNINLATAKLGQLLVRSGCDVKVITLTGPEKGVDDWFMVHGESALAQLFATAIDLGYWQAAKLWSLTYAPTLTLNQPYLGEVPYPETGLVAVKSPKGTGKTTALQPLIQGAIAQGRKVLAITHRIQLGRAICEGLGISWIDDVRSVETQTLAGYGLCIDSLHPNSQARFNPQDWHGAIVILDEVEQVLWHALNSNTCYKNRVRILETLKELVQVVSSTGGLLVVQDADLSDVSLDYLRGLMGTIVPPWLLVNHYQPEHGWQVSLYDTKNAAPLVARMEQVIETGAVFVSLDSQKVTGKWSSKNLETYLQGRFPTKRILRIDSETVSNPTHPAYGIADHINQTIHDYDIVLATPTIGTGVSIDVRGHFKGVFGIFQGVTPDSESRQALSRVREAVPRFVWAAHFGPAKIGNGSCSYWDIVQSTARAVKYNIALLKDVDFDLDRQTDPIALRTWAKMAARVNTSLWSYRSELGNSLVTEGHAVTLVTDDVGKILGQQVVTEELQYQVVTGAHRVPGFEFLGLAHDAKTAERVVQAMTGIRSSNQAAEAEAISNSPELSHHQYDEIKDQRAQTTKERNARRKHELQNRYAVAVTPELKLKDDQGWYAQLRLHYYLTHDPLFVELRDKQEWQAHLDRGNGKVALQDVKLFTAQVEALKALNVLQFLKPNHKMRSTDPEVQVLAEQALKYRQDFKVLFNLTISEKLSSVAILQALLGKIGAKLNCVGRDQAADGRRGGLRVYRYYPPEDDRDTIFAEW